MPPIEQILSQSFSNSSFLASGGVLGSFVLLLVVLAVFRASILKKLKRIHAKSTRDGASRAFKSMSTLVSVVLWCVGILFLLSNLGVNVTSIVAGLGIGGIAIAFALQHILSDLFSSFAIQFDKLFEVGDKITVGSHTGIVEKIGIRTTRLRSSADEEIIIPNKDLASSIVINHARHT